MPVPAVARLMPRFAAPGALLVSLGLFACGSSGHSLDGAKVERAIARSIMAEHGLYTNVACPPKVVQKAGEVFTCTAHFDVGTYPVTATETNASGHVRYQDQQPLVVLNIAKVQRAIEDSVFGQRHLSSSVSCPSEVLQRAGIVFRCTAVIAGSARRYPFVVSELDNSGHVRYLGA